MLSGCCRKCKASDNTGWINISPSAPRLPYKELSTLHRGSTQLTVSKSHSTAQRHGKLVTYCVLLGLADVGSRLMCEVAVSGGELWRPLICHIHVRPAGEQLTCLLSVWGIWGWTETEFVRDETLYQGQWHRVHQSAAFPGEIYSQVSQLNRIILSGVGSNISL